MKAIKSFLVLSTLLLSYACSMEATQEEADLLFAEGNFEGAVAKYDMVVKLEPNN